MAMDIFLTTGWWYAVNVHNLIKTTLSTLFFNYVSLTAFSMAYLSCLEKHYRNNIMIYVYCAC